LLSIIQFLAQHNLAFRGSSEKVNQRDNGNFLALVELIGKFDPVLQEHLRRITSDEIHDHYHGKRIQNELITLMADKVKETILDSARQAKYFSIILD